eukprot:TRINITY_DN29337_c0_g1_i2.p1 TRINITY_DN29337_c0_g1~~TRINITY_DN29337_c0_g1_i2.p1  ORF type:complete len:401 (+),score=73.67 TRINITY_DN29337_c0_g1_i2:170-1204(+)
MYLVLDRAPAMMFRIGNTLLYDGLPEVLIFMEGGLHPGMCGRLLNDLVGRMRHGEVNIGQSVKEIWSGLDVVDETAVLRHASADELSELGMMSWFHRNFLDSELLETNVWVVHLKAVEDAASEDDAEEADDSDAAAAISALYEGECNIVHVKHGTVKEKPALQLPHTMPGEVIRVMAGGLTATELATLRQELEKDVMTPWAFRHAPAVLHGKALVDHMAKEAKRVQAEKQGGNAECEPHAELEELMRVAVGNNQPASVAQLAELGLSGERLKGNGEDRSLLMQAVQFGFDGVVEQLLRYKAPLDDTDCEALTALSIAAYGQVHGSQEKASRILDLLWDAGARLM